jgi:hypothetical protein
MLTIGELAKATDTKVVTVRYYEQAGLLFEKVRMFPAWSQAIIVNGSGQA